jgi:cell division protein ZapA
MQELSIKIRIYDRQYPMKLQPNDEAQIRKAALQINEQIKVYKDQFNSLDIQDILSMVAFDCMVEKLKVQKELSTYQQQIERQLNDLGKVVDGIT